MIRVCCNLLNVLQHNGSELAYTTGSMIGRRLSFRSDLSLDKLYPHSRLKLFTQPPPNTQGVKFSGYIPIDKLVITYSHSSGPGGQHVNCVNTKVDIRFKLTDADWIPEKTRQKLLASLKNKVNKDGYFVIKSDLTRSQQLNLADALEKLRTLIRNHELEKAVSTDETLEVIRRRHEKAARERLTLKRQRSQTKALRQSPSDVEF